MFFFVPISVLEPPELAALWVNQKEAESSGLAVRSDVQEARRIFIAEGFAGLRKALNNGAILPAVAAVAAVAAAVVAPSVLLGQNESQQM